MIGHFQSPPIEESNVTARSLSGHIEPSFQQDEWALTTLPSASIQDQNEYNQQLWKKDVACTSQTCCEQLKVIFKNLFQLTDYYFFKF